MWKVCENDDASSKRWLAAGWEISAQPDKSSYANGGALCSIQLALNWATDMRGIKLYGAPFNKEGSLELETITQTEFGEANRVNLEHQKVIHDQGIKIKKLQQLNDELIKSAKVTEKIIKFMSAENRALRNEK